MYNAWRHWFSSNQNPRSSSDQYFLPLFWRSKWGVHRSKQKTVLCGEGGRGRSFAQLLQNSLIRQLSYKPNALCSLLTLRLFWFTSFTPKRSTLTTALRDGKKALSIFLGSQQCLFAVYHSRLPGLQGTQQKLESITSQFRHLLWSGGKTFLALYNDQKLS